MAAALALLVVIVTLVMTPFSMIGDAIERRYGKPTRRRVAWITGGTIVFLMWAVPIGVVIWGHATGRL